MTPVATTKLLTAEEFARLPEPGDGSRQELVHGVVETMPPPGFRHGDVQANICFALKHFLRSSQIGRVVVESGVKTDKAPDSVRGPDVSFWSFKRLPANTRPDGYPDVLPDLVVEVRSPSDSNRKVREKVKEYLFNGVALVWVVDPEDQTVTIYRQPDDGRVLGES